MMGGEREKVIPASSSKTITASSPKIITANDVRIHESGGSVHLHDDKTGLKVEVPVADFWKEWQRRRSDFRMVSFVDRNLGTIAIIDPILDRSSRPWKVAVEVKIGKVDVTDSFRDLDDFCAGK